MIASQRQRRLDHSYGVVGHRQLDGMRVARRKDDAIVVIRGDTADQSLIDAEPNFDIADDLLNTRKRGERCSKI